MPFAVSITVPPLVCTYYFTIPWYNSYCPLAFSTLLVPLAVPPLAVPLCCISCLTALFTALL